MLRAAVYLALVASLPGFMCGCNRSRADAQIVGTWTVPQMDSTNDYTFTADHTFVLSGQSLGEYTVFSRGTWILEANRILLRVKDREGGELVIMNIADVTRDELKIKHANSIEILRRIKTMTPEEIQRKAVHR